MFCVNCGKEISNDISFCGFCGAKVGCFSSQTVNTNLLLSTLSQRLHTNGIIWIIIGILQILGGIFINWFLIIPGVLNIVSSINDINYSKTIINNPVGIVEKVTPLTAPIITLIYNLVIGGLIGVVGSIYYFVSIRSFVLENKHAFQELEQTEK